MPAHAGQASSNHLWRDGASVVSRAPPNGGTRDARSAMDLQIVRRHLAASTVGDQLEVELLAFLQVPQTGALNGADVNECVGSTLVGLNHLTVPVGMTCPFRRQQIRRLATCQPWVFSISGTKGVGWGVAWPPPEASSSDRSLDGTRCAPFPPELQEAPIDPASPARSR